MEVATHRAWLGVLTGGSLGPHCVARPSRGKPKGCDYDLVTRARRFGDLRKQGPADSIRISDFIVVPKQMVDPTQNGLETVSVRLIDPSSYPQLACGSAFSSSLSHSMAPANTSRF